MIFASLGYEYVFAKGKGMPAQWKFDAVGMLRDGPFADPESAPVGDGYDMVLRCGHWSLQKLAQNETVRAMNLIDVSRSNLYDPKFEQSTFYPAGWWGINLIVDDSNNRKYIEQVRMMPISVAFTPPPVLAAAFIVLSKEKVLKPGVTVRCGRQSTHRWQRLGLKWDHRKWALRVILANDTPNKNCYISTAKFLAPP